MPQTLASMAKDQIEKEADVLLYSAMLRAENKVGGGEGLEGVYGSITRAGTAEVLDAFKEHAMLDQDSVVLDIGSGLGRPLLHALVHSNVAATYGIEVDAVKCQKAVPFVRHVCGEMAAHGISLPAASLPKFICAPIEQIPSLEPATHVYAAWEGFARGAMQSIGALFAASSTAKAITIVQRSFRQRDAAEEMAEMGFGRVRLVATMSVSMSGSRRRLVAYCFVKDPMPERSSGSSKRAAGAELRRAEGGAASDDLSTLPAFDPVGVLDVLASQASERSEAKAAAAATKPGADKRGADGASAAGSGPGPEQEEQRGADTRSVRDRGVDKARGVSSAAQSDSEGSDRTVVRRIGLRNSRVL